MDTGCGSGLLTQLLAQKVWPAQRNRPSEKYSNRRFTRPLLTSLGTLLLVRLMYLSALRNRRITLADVDTASLLPKTLTHT
jgi:hypothetical protein